MSDEVGVFVERERGQEFRLMIFSNFYGMAEEKGTSFNSIWGTMVMTMMC